MPVSLEVSRLTRRFGRLTALSELSFSVPAGSVTALVGANGAGKTTTFSVIAGFLRPHGGTVTVDGEDIYSYRRRGGRLGLLPQDVQFYDERSVERQLLLFARLEGFAVSAARKEVARVLELVHLQDKARQTPGALSCGMKARLGVAQALIGEPPLILLDEPTAGLDPRMLSEFRRTVDALRGKTTLVISSHDLSELEALCNYVCIIDAGRLVRQGPLSELLAASSTVQFELADELQDLKEIAAYLDPWKVSAAGERTILVRFDPREADTASVNSKVIRWLLEHNQSVLNVRSQKTLEQSYFEATETKPSGD